MNRVELAFHCIRSNTNQKKISKKKKKAKALSRREKTPSFLEDKVQFLLPFILYVLLPIGILTNLPSDLRIRCHVTVPIYTCSAHP